MRSRGERAAQRRRLAALLSGVALLAACAQPAIDTVEQIVQQLTLPLRSDSVRFAVIGDTGTGGRQQYEVAARMAEYRKRFPFDFVLMLGDNMYGRETPADFVRKFERPYQPLLDGGVKFYAALGNHDEPSQRFYAKFNMGGERYYTFTRGIAQFFALDSNYMDPTQLAWLERELASSGARWKIAFFHHPLYSSGRLHGSSVDLRERLEPLFVRYGMNLVFAGHEHIYERVKPQKGVSYFTSGGAAKLTSRVTPLKTTWSGLTYHTDRHFMLIEISGDELAFQAIARSGTTIDSGVIPRLAPSPLLSPGRSAPSPTRRSPGAASPLGDRGRRSRPRAARRARPCGGSGCRRRRAGRRAPSRGRAIEWWAASGS
jgi:hypothetical protein